MEEQGRKPQQEDDSRVIMASCIAAISLVIYLYLFFTNA